MYNALTGQVPWIAFGEVGLAHGADNPPKRTSGQPGRRVVSLDSRQAGETYMTPTFPHNEAPAALGNGGQGLSGELTCLSRGRNVRTQGGSWT